MHSPRRRQLGLALVSSAAVIVGLFAATTPVAAEDGPRPSPRQATAGAATAGAASLTLTNRAWDSLYTARQADVDYNWFMGHPLDAVWDGSGNAFSSGEFAQSVARVTDNGATATGVLLPLKVVGSWDWVDPFVDSFTPLDANNQYLVKPYSYTSGSALGERVIKAGGYIWAAFGGSMHVNPQDSNAANHSILMRIDISNPGNVCSVPVPGDNNQVNGLAYDAAGTRVFFTQYAGDHLTNTGVLHSTLSFVKNNTTLCRNSLDFNDRAAAQTAVNSLACTPAQNATWSHDCVHRVNDTMPHGATHVTYDGAANALWINNVSNNSLYKYDVGARALRPAIALPGPWGVNWPWQVQANSTHVFVNEYATNRIHRYTKANGAWSTVDLPVADPLKTHSIDLQGNRLWFTVSDEKLQSSPSDPVRSWIGYLDVPSWTASSVSGVRLTGWDRLGHAKGAHSFRGLDVSSTGKVVVTNDGNREITTLHPR